jgi:hypothetical protein
MKKYVRNLLVAIDQLFNAIFGGSPDECISTRAYDHYPRLERFINWLFCNPKHCEESKNNEADEGVID